MIQFLLMKNTTNKLLDITQIIEVGSKLSKGKDDLCWGLSFTVFKDQLYIECGDVIAIKYNSKEVFNGVIVSTNSNSFKALDFGFYFNKNKHIFQFEDVESSEAIKLLIESIGGEIGNIEKTNTMIDKLYFNQALGSIIKEIMDNIIELEGITYSFYYKNGVFNFEKCKKDKYKAGVHSPLKALNGIFNGFNFNGLNYIVPPTRSTSIEDLRNSIRVYEQTGNEYINDSEAKNEISINKYGLMQEVIEIKENEKHIAEKKAENILKELNKVKETVSFSINFGTFDLAPLDILDLNYQEYNVIGIYEITSISYDISNNVKVNLELERVS